jgi:hypothetical protein
MCETGRDLDFEQKICRPAVYRGKGTASGLNLFARIVISEPDTRRQSPAVLK